MVAPFKRVLSQTGQLDEWLDRANAIRAGMARELGVDYVPQVALVGKGTARAD